MIPRRTMPTRPLPTSKRRAVGPLPALFAAALAIPLSAAGGRTPQDLDGAAFDELRALPGDEHAFLEVATTRPTCYVGERVALVLRIGFETGFLEEHLVQLFRRPLDVPAQVEAPWWSGLACARMLAGPAREGERVELALGDSVVTARRAGELERDGMRFETFELERDLVPSCVGALEVPAARLRFAFATRFRDDLLQGRVPLDRVDALVRSAPLALEVLPLPEDGRPLAFSGAIGRFEVEAAARPREVEEGESLLLALVVRGAGNLLDFEAPRLDELAGFHVRGSKTARTDGEARVEYDLAPLRASVREVPAIRFAYFDPEAGAYRVVETRPIAIEVRPSERAAEPGRAAPTDPRPAKSGAISEEEPGTRSWPRAVAVALAVLGSLALGRMLRRRSRDQRAARAERARAERASQAFRAHESAGDAELANAFAELLAGALGCSTAAVIGGDLRARLAAAGVPDGIAQRAAELLDALVAARFGGHAPADARARLAAIATELERHFRATSARERR